MMIRVFIWILILLSPVLLQANDDLIYLDRSGSFYISPKGALSFPAGRLADGNFSLIASSWRQEGLTVTGEFGFYLTNQTVFGFEISYSNFPPKHLPAFNGVIADKSRVRVRRTGIYMQYQLIPSGRLRPFMKLAFGFFDLSRLAMPLPATSPQQYSDTYMSGKSYYGGGIGFMYNLSRKFSFSFSVEAVSMNSFSTAYETEGPEAESIHSNLLFFPLYFGISYHLSGE